VAVEPLALSGRSHDGTDHFAIGLARKFHFTETNKGFEQSFEHFFILAETGTPIAVPLIGNEAIIGLLMFDVNGLASGRSILSGQR
jgi:hypothetical protein